MQTSFHKSQHRILLSVKAHEPVINLTDCHYNILPEVTSKMGIQVADVLHNLLWTDCPLSIREIKAQHPDTKINHIPEVTQITRKNKMANNLNTLRSHFPKDYCFYPETWVLPSDYQRLIKKHSRGKVYIVKPENGCQGQGIYLTVNPHKLEKERSLIVQEYLPNPMLLNGLKFDLRMYVLITCVSPLRIYLYNEGIVRCATEMFEKVTENNINNYFSHLTNYAINKQSEKFKVDVDNSNNGHKRLISSVFKNEEYKQLMQKVAKIVIKTVISGLPAIQNAQVQTKRTDPNSFFQLLGFDIMLTDKKEPILLEVNQNPSLSTDTPLDHKLKFALVKNIFEMVTGGYRIGYDEKFQTRIKLKDRHQTENRGDFQKIYPCEHLQDTESFDQYIAKAQTLYKERFGVGVLRSVRKSKETALEEESMAWNENPLHYTHDKVQRVYGVRLTKTSIHKKRLIFI